MPQEPTPQDQKPTAAKATLTLVTETLGGFVGSVFGGVRTIVFAVPIFAYKVVYNNRDPETERMLRESQQQNRENQKKLESCFQMSMIFIVIALLIAVIAVLFAAYLLITGHSP